MSKSLIEQIAEAREAVVEVERPAGPATVSRVYDPAQADEILGRVLELAGGWKVNFAAIQNGGKNARGEAGVLGALLTERHNPLHPRGVVLYNGNRGPNATLSGFSPEEVDTILGASG